MTPFFWGGLILVYLLRCFAPSDFFVLTSQRFGGVLGVTPFCSISSLLPYFTFRCEAPSLPTTQLSAAYSTHTKINGELKLIRSKETSFAFSGLGSPNHPHKFRDLHARFRIQKSLFQVKSMRCFSSPSQAKKDCYQRWCFERSPIWWENTYQVPKFFPPTSLSYFKKCRETK